MKLIETRNAVGHVLCHDMTQIIPGVFKGARFSKGHVVTEEDIPVLLSMGKENLYVWEVTPGMLHENDAALRLCALCQNENMHAGEVKEGKIELVADCDGLFQVDVARLEAVNEFDDVMIATRHGNTAVRKGDKLAGMRIIPLVIDESRLATVEAIARENLNPESKLKSKSDGAFKPLLKLTPWKLKTCGLIATGSEVAKGLIKDKFTPVVINKLNRLGVEVTKFCTPGDDQEAITNAALEFHRAGVDLVLCTGGMSVDPDDRTPGAIKATGAEIIRYGSPVLPGAMFLLGYFDGNPDTPICGLPGCVMFAGATVFDLLLPRIIAGVKISRADISSLGHGGLCLGCKECHYPICPFGK